MAFRTARSLAAEYQRLKDFAKIVRERAVSWKAQLAAGNVSVFAITHEMLPLLKSASEQFASVPAGLAQYAKDQEDDQTYDVAAEFVAMRNAVNAARDRIVSTVPQDANNVLRERTINADGSITLSTVTPAQTSNLQTDLQAIVDAIEA